MTSTDNIAHEAKRTDLWFKELPEALEKALENYDPNENGDFNELYALATLVEIEGYSVHGEFSVISDDCWIAPGTVYATLVYEPNSEDRTEFSDSYPIRVYYTVNGQEVAIRKIQVDVSSFYE